MHAIHEMTKYSFFLFFFLIIVHPNNINNNNNNMNDKTIIMIVLLELGVSQVLGCLSMACERRKEYKIEILNIFSSWIVHTCIHTYISLKIARPRRTARNLF